MPPTSGQFQVALRLLDFEHLAHEKMSSNAFDRDVDASTAGEGAYLYFWSFNSFNRDATVAVNAGSRMTLLPATIQEDYPSGWAYDLFDGGSCLSAAGIEEVLLYMPLEQVQNVASFGFDISSSATGPKSFRLEYSQNGVLYTLLSADNQFANVSSAQYRHSFSFSFAALDLNMGQPLYIKIIPLAGERGGSSYNPKAGVMRLDNIFLRGTHHPTGLQEEYRFEYHVFDQENGQLVQRGQQVFSERHPELSLSLDEGSYKALFLVSPQQQPFAVAQAFDAADLALSSLDDDPQLILYGAVESFTIRKDQALNLMLRRYFSEVTFEFTDLTDLSHIHRIEVYAAHEPIVFRPFHVDRASEQYEARSQVFYPSFNREDKTFRFHQFMGHTTMPIPLQYSVKIFNQQQEQIVEFAVEAAIRNNIKLHFKGELNHLVVQNPQFSVQIYPDWDAMVDGSF